MQGRIAELFTGDLVNRTEESICYGTANKGALSPDLSGGVALVIPALRGALAIGNSTDRSDDKDQTDWIAGLSVIKV